MPTAAVLGAGGKTGQECVKELVNKGYSVKAIVRSPEKYTNTFASIPGTGKVEIVPGDVTDTPSIQNAIAGASDGVIFAASGTTYFSAKAVDYQGVVNTVEAVKGAKLSGPIVLISSCLVSPHNGWHPIRMMLNTFRWRLMDEKYKGEEALRNSGLAYTVIRPGGLKDGPAGERRLLVGQGDRSSGAVMRADVAAVSVAALKDPAARNVTLELNSAVRGDGEKVPSLGEQLQGIFNGLERGS